MNTNYKKRTFSNVELTQKKLEKIWNNELSRWSAFVDIITKNPNISNYKGYIISRAEHSCSILLDTDLRIYFSYNSKVAYIAYQQLFSDDCFTIAGIYKYSTNNPLHQYGASICGYNIFHNDSSINSTTLLDMMLSATFFFSKLGRIQIHASATKKLLKILEKEFGVELTEYEKESINDLDLLIKQYDNSMDIRLCEWSKQ